MKKKININCPIGKTGYGITSLNIVKELYINLDLDVALFPIGNNMELNGEYEKPIIHNMMESALKYEKKSPFLKIWHQNDLAFRVGTGDYFSFPFFEIDTFSDQEKHHMNCCDAMFTTCSWSKTILQSNDIDIPIHVAPLGVDTNIFKYPEKIRIDNGKYVFAHIGKWEHRKAQDFLLKAFESAFDIPDNVELWLLPHNPFLNEAEVGYWLKLVEDNKLRDKIRIYNRLPTQHHLSEFISNIDCGVFLSRAEGWNNEILECMALNKPIIATNYSAHTEYCNNSNSYLVNVENLELANDNKWFFGQGKWAKLSDNELSQTIDHMRYVYKNKITTNPDGLDTAKKYSWNQTARIIKSKMIK